ncbi:Protein SLG1, partial [Knufia obscura]
STTISSESDIASQITTPVMTLTVSPTPPPAAASEIQSMTRTFEFGPLSTLGCFSAYEPLTEDHTDTHQSLESCQSACGNEHYPIMALTAGSVCYCGNTSPAPDKLVGDNKCDAPCNGKKEQTCGGIGSWQVYSFDYQLDGPANKVTPAPTCSASVVTVYVTGTPDLSTSTSSTPPYLNTSTTAYPTGWSSPRGSGMTSHISPSTIIGTTSATTESVTPVKSTSSVVPTISNPATSTRTAPPSITSYHGSAGRVRPHGLFLLFARLLTLSTFAQAQALEERFYPYPTPVNGPLPSATGVPPAVRIVSEPPALEPPMDTASMISATTMSTTTAPSQALSGFATVLSPANDPASISSALLATLSSPLGPSGEPASSMTGSPDIPASISSALSASLGPPSAYSEEPVPSMTHGPGTFATWWTSTRDMTVTQTVTVPGVAGNETGAPATILTLTSTVPSVINITSVITSIASSTKTMTSTEMVQMTMTTPPFSSPAMSDTPTSDASIYRPQAQDAVVLFNMLAGCAMFVYIMHFM